MEQPSVILEIIAGPRFRGGAWPLERSIRDLSLHSFLGPKSRSGHRRTILARLAAEWGSWSLRDRAARARTAQRTHSATTRRLLPRPARQKSGSRYGRAGGWSSRTPASARGPSGSWASVGLLGLAKVAPCPHAPPVRAWNHLSRLRKSVTGSTNIY